MTLTLRVLPARDKTVDVRAQHWVKFRFGFIKETSSQFTIFVKKLLQAIVVHVIPKVLDVDIGKLFGLGAEFSLPFFARFETTHKPENGKRAAKHTLVKQSWHG